jgi:hypothetical protein
MIKYLDPSTANKLLAWNEHRGLRDGLVRTAWYRGHLDALAPLEDVAPVSFSLPAFA